MNIYRINKGAFSSVRVMSFLKQLFKSEHFTDVATVEDLPCQGVDVLAFDHAQMHSTPRPSETSPGGTTSFGYKFIEKACDRCKPEIIIYVFPVDLKADEPRHMAACEALRRLMPAIKVFILETPAFGKIHETLMVPTAAKVLGQDQRAWNDPIPPRLLPNPAGERGTTVYAKS